MAIDRLEKAVRIVAGHAAYASRETLIDGCRNEIDDLCKRRLLAILLGCDDTRTHVPRRVEQAQAFA
jgi:hypothetical protein